MCRWSGKLGPKTKIGDRQAPEGFYDVTMSRLNPKSKFFLSFNLGYPNRLEQSLGYTGEALMVHGACSSSGCYAMSDQAIGEIYAVVENALHGRQSAFQVQAYPFRMTPKNLAVYRNDPNMPFWKNLKEGYDIFEVSRRERRVSLCGKRYVFDAQFADGEPNDPLEACPARVDQQDSAVLAKAKADGEKVSAIAGSSALPLAYQDGGMHPNFVLFSRRTARRSFLDVCRSSNTQSASRRQRSRIPSSWEVDSVSRQCWRVGRPLQSNHQRMGSFGQVANLRQTVIGRLRTFASDKLGD